MADPTTKMTHTQAVRNGEGPLSARFHNQAIDAILDQQRRSPLGTNPETRLGSEQIIWIQNMAGADLAIGAIVGLGDPAVTPTDDEDSFLSRTILGSDDPATASPFAVLIDPIPDGDESMGRAVLMGPAVCRIDVTDAAHTWAAPAAGDYDKLLSQAGQGPAKILWKESGTGEKWALVNLVGALVSAAGITVDDADDSDITYDSGTGVLNIPNAGTGQRGAVNAVAQTIDGPKWLQDGAVLYAGFWADGDYYTTVVGPLRIITDEIHGDIDWDARTGLSAATQKAAHVGTQSIIVPAYNALATYQRGYTAESGGVYYYYHNATPSAGNAPPNALYWGTFDPDTQIAVWECIGAHPGDHVPSYGLYSSIGPQDDGFDRLGPWFVISDQGNSAAFPKGIAFRRHDTGSGIVTYIFGKSVGGSSDSFQFHGGALVGGTFVTDGYLSIAQGGTGNTTGSIDGGPW